jgi:hypothetical protein
MVLCMLDEVVHGSHVGRSKRSGREVETVGETPPILTDTTFNYLAETRILTHLKTFAGYRYNTIILFGSLSPHSFDATMVSVSPPSRSLLIISAFVVRRRAAVFFDSLLATYCRCRFSV